MIHAHTAYGLALHLPFRCPVLPEDREDISPDVTMVEGPVPYDLASPVAQEENWQAEPGRFLWRAGRRAGRFLVENGRRITLQRSPIAEDEEISSHFLDSVLAAVLRQNGMIVLHANSLITPNGAIAVSGESGVGKSTTLGALLQRGCFMLADDITALRNRNGCVEVIPGVPQFFLYKDVADGLGHKNSGLPHHRRKRGKIVVSAQLAMAKDPAPLKAIYLLQTHLENEVSVRSLNGTEKFAAMHDCIYGPVLPDEHPALFPLFTALMQQIAVFRILRPANRWTVNTVAEVLLHG